MPQNNADRNGLLFFLIQKCYNGKDGGQYSGYLNVGAAVKGPMKLLRLHCFPCLSHGKKKQDANNSWSPPKLTVTEEELSNRCTCS